MSTTPNDPNKPGNDPNDPSYGSTPSYGDSSTPSYGDSSTPSYGAAPSYGDQSGAGYGATPGYGAPGQGQSAGGTNALAIASLVLGILGILTACFYGVPGIVLGGIGLVLGILARKKVRAGEAGQGGLAKAGLITSIVSIVLGIVVLILSIAGISYLMNQDGECDIATMSQDEYAQCLEDELNN